MSSHDTRFQAPLWRKVAEMKRRHIRIYLLGFLIMVILATFNTANAQDKEKPEKPRKDNTEKSMEESPPLSPSEGTEVAVINFEVEPKFQSVSIDQDSSKAIEYRSLPEGLYLDDILYEYDSSRQEFRGEISRLYLLTDLSDDAYSSLHYRRYGLVEAEFGVSRFPRHFEDSFSGKPDTQRDLYNLAFRLTPGTGLEITTSLSIEDRQGRKPLTVENITGISTNPTAVLEIREQVDYTTAAFGIGLEYLDEMINLQLNNDLQIFRTNIKSAVTWDNPFISGATGRAEGLDDYIVHTLIFKPAITFSNKIRLINSLTYRRVTNSIDLAPLSTAGIGDSFTQDTLDPDVRNLSLSSILSTRPWNDIKLNLKYRYNALENDTPFMEATPSYVMLDGSTPDLIRYPRIARYTSYSTTSLVLNSAWHMTHTTVMDAEIENKDVSRTQREVSDENEKRLSLSLNTVFTDYLSGMAGYTYKRRRGDYDETYYNTLYDPNPANSTIQHPLMRAFDLSSRDSSLLSFRLNYAPLETLNLLTTLFVESSDHPGVRVGRKHSQRESVSVSFQYSLWPGLLLFSDYIYDRRTIEDIFTWSFDSSLPYPQDTNPAYPDFTQPIKEDIKYVDKVLAAGFNLEIDQKIILTGSYSRYDSGEESISLPKTSSITNTFEITLSFKPDRRTFASFKSFLHIEEMRLNTGYYLEHYDRKDYALDNFPVAGTDSYLGIRSPDYSLHIVSLSLSLYF